MRNYTGISDVAEPFEHFALVTAATPTLSRSYSECSSGLPNSPFWSTASSFKSTCKIRFEDDARRVRQVRRETRPR